MASPDSAGKFAYQVKRIKEVYFSVNERLHVPDPDKMVKWELNPMFGFSVEENLVGINFRVFFHYPERPEDEILTEIRVETVFELKGLKSYLDKRGILILPPLLITTFVSLAYTHTRAIFAQKLAGTAFQEVILQVVNPEQIARYFFGYMFDEEKEVVQTDETGKLVTKEAVNTKPKKAAKATTRRKVRSK